MEFCFYSHLLVNWETSDKHESLQGFSRDDITFQSVIYVGGFFFFAGCPIRSWSQGIGRGGTGSHGDPSWASTQTDSRLTWASPASGLWGKLPFTANGPSVLSTRPDEDLPDFYSLSDRWMRNLGEKKHNRFALSKFPYCSNADRQVDSLLIHFMQLKQTHTCF